MRTIQIDFSKEYKRFCDQLSFDPNLTDYKVNLVDWPKLDNVLVLRNQFFFINDFTTSKIIYVHPNVEKILGYTADSFTDFGSIYNLIHPDDCEFVLEISKRTVQVASMYKNDILKEPFKTLFSIDFRVKHKNGRYLRLNRQSCCYKSDNEGNMVLAILLFSDVTQLSRTETYNTFWLGHPEYLCYFDDLIQKYQNCYKITSRERDILKLLADGKSATDIAENLSLSVHTVISHRKNMLRKTRTKNSVELVKFAIEKALITALSICFLDTLL